MNHLKLSGLVAAPHTPFTAEGALKLSTVEQQARHLLANGVNTAFIGGSTGECQSLMLQERLDLAQRWFEVAAGTPLKIIVHVGSNCLGDSRVLAAQAEKLGATAIGAFPPSYFKPRNVAMLVDCCADIAAAAPATPFYYYDIPSMTAVTLPMPEFAAEARARIPSFNGIKYTSADLMSFQLCLQVADGSLDILWGMDECLLAALSLGARGCVGSTYNFAAPIYHRLWGAFEDGDLVTARQEQLRSVRLVKVLIEANYFGAAKAVMRMLGVEVGPARKPHPNPTPAQEKALRVALEQLGYFDWIRGPQAKSIVTASPEVDRSSLKPASSLAPLPK
jgi:N-acetylneuraminate lyase